MKENLGKCLLADDMLCIAWSIHGTCMTSYRSGSIYVSTCSIKERIHVRNKQFGVCPGVSLPSD